MLGAADAVILNAQEESRPTLPTACVTYQYMQSGSTLVLQAYLHMPPSAPEQDSNLHTSSAAAAAVFLSRCLLIEPHNAAELDGKVGLLRHIHVVMRMQAGPSVRRACA